MRVWCGAHNGPYAGAGAAVEDSLGILQRGQMQFLVKGQEVHVVGKVEDLLCQLVVGAPVCAVAVGMVLAAVFHAVVEDRRGKRVGTIAQEAAAIEARVRRGAC